MTPATPKERAALPSEDKRWKLVAACMKRHGFQANSLIETLHAVQEAFGFLDDVALRFVAQSLRLPLSMVYGVATFYHFFTLKPKGRHTCVVCTGTACHIKGTPDILRAIREKYGVAPGETTPDNELSVLSARCVGACGLAPAVVFDGEVAGRLNAEQTLERLAARLETVHE